MPYRHAHRWLILLFPMIALAFWPGYFGRLGTAPFALHAHGITATAWLALLTAQSWSIATGRIAWHRASGLATFVVLPLFAAAGPLALHSMASSWRTDADPFHAAYGARLAIADLIAGAAVIAMVAYALWQRRRVAVHASAMLATALLVLPPILGRLLPAVPGYPSGGVAGFDGFHLSFELANLLTLLIAIVLAMRREARGVGFAFAAIATAAQMIAFETIGDTDAWHRCAILLTDMPPLLLAVAAMLASGALLWWAWHLVPPRTTMRRDVAPAGL
ncbi:hypothetical protein ASE73_12545 [Sphingomonas sp. Leaf24]|uniref:hypothetical protein n=1 Tax=unclassified Sphingomonas TaxID=196159 RepID=UPI0006F84848|nr:MULTISPECIES: hypothetical protein [unclassified Sphingomonas]KQM85850.1 hypothetical protein ASE73_12545 [Sphingomonas sp. Leaf24]